MRKKGKREKGKKVLKQEKATFKQRKTDSLGAFFRPLPIHPSIRETINQSENYEGKGGGREGKGRGENLFNPPPLRLPIPLCLSF